MAKNVRFIYDAPNMILRAYKKFGNGTPFALTSLAEYQVLVSSEEDIQAVCESSSEVLSFQQAMIDVDTQIICISTIDI
jgi:hypothetical protein